jgi:hypothetical protein
MIEDSDVPEVVVAKVAFPVKTDTSAIFVNKEQQSSMPIPNDLGRRELLLAHSGHYHISSR